MILLTDIMQMLAEGEFSSLNLHDKDTGNIKQEHLEKVIMMINRGMVDIHKRIYLFQREIDIYTQDGVIDYQIRLNRMAASVSRLTSRAYCLQPSDFKGQVNLVEIKSVFDENDKELTINDRNQSPRIEQSSFDALRIVGADPNTRFSVVYQSYPDKIVLDDNFDMDTYVVNVSDSILEALLNFVASKIYPPTGTNDSTANADKGSYYQSQYELAMAQLKLLGLDLQSNDSDVDKFARQGWA